MTNIQVADITLRKCEQENAIKLSFKEKQEIAKLLEAINADIIETDYVTEAPADAVYVRMLAGALEQSILCVPVESDKESIDRAWAVLSKAKKPRINLIIPTSTVGIEYGKHMKPEAVIPLVSELVAYAKTLCDDVEFTAKDAVRSESVFLADVVRAAVKAGASTITMCDSAGELLPEEAGAFITSIIKAVPELSGVTIGFHIKDNIALASASALSAIAAGAELIKVSGGNESNTLSLEGFLRILKTRGETLGITCNLNTVSYQRICARLRAMTGLAGQPGRVTALQANESGSKAAENAVVLTGKENITELRSYIQVIGYDISEEDLGRIYTQYRDVARNKKVVADDIEALIAETAGQAPPIYQLHNFVINSGNQIKATAYVEFVKDGEIREALSTGDGPIDAAFKAADIIFGRHYELEDFQIHAVTSGREATGDALIKLRCDGKLYSGRGVSTDIVGASIRAYISAVNKILSDV